MVDQRKTGLQAARKARAGRVMRTLLPLVLAVFLAACAGQPIEGGCEGPEGACNAVGKRIRVFWNPRRESTNVYVVRFRLGADGKLAGPPTVMTPANGDPKWAEDRDEAIRAVYRAQPFDVAAAGSSLIEVTLDPRWPRQR
jgi:hypothetical protein